MSETYSIRCKKEIIASINDAKPCCLSAFVYGAICFSKAFGKDGILFSAKNGFIIDAVSDALQREGVAQECLIRRSSGSEFSLEITDASTVDRLLFEYGYIGNEANFRLNESCFMCEDCFRSFLAGCFVYGGTVTDPKVNYHLEFITNKFLFASDFASLLMKNELPAKFSRRYYSRVVYFKDSSIIEDILILCGAGRCSMELMNKRIEKDINNSVNRQINCDSANTDKAINAALAMCADIRLIYESGGRGMLGDELAAVADARLENPECSLAELACELKPPISKSGLNHKFEKIKRIANAIREQQNDNSKG